MVNSSDNLRFDNTIEVASAVLGRKTIAADACRETVRRARVGWPCSSIRVG